MRLSLFPHGLWVLDLASGYEVRAALCIQIGEVDSVQLSSLQFLSLFGLD